MEIQSIVNLFENNKYGEKQAKEYLKSEELLSYIEGVNSQQNNRIKPRYCDLPPKNTLKSWDYQRVIGINRVRPLKRDNLMSAVNTGV